MSIALETKDGQVFQVPREVATMSVTIANMLADVEDDDSTDPIMLPNLTGPSWKPTRNTAPARSPVPRS